MRRSERKRPRYDEKKRGKAILSAVLRVVVAVYIIYLGINIAMKSGGPDTSMKPWMGWCFCAFFSVVGILFVLYTVKQYQSAIKDAELPEEPRIEEN